MLSNLIMKEIYGSGNAPGTEAKGRDDEDFGDDELSKMSFHVDE